MTPAQATIQAQILVIDEQGSGVGWSFADWCDRTGLDQGQRVRLMTEMNDTGEAVRRFQGRLYTLRVDPGGRVGRADRRWCKGGG